MVHYIAKDDVELLTFLFPGMTGKQPPFVYSVLGFETRASHALGKHFAI